MKSNNPIPPKLAQRLLLRFLRDNLTEEVQGDLDEKFYTTTKTKSIFKAKLNYWYQVINYLRPFALRKSKAYTNNNYAMFENYFKIGWRNLSKQKMYSVIKIGGFAIGIAACFLIALFIRDELSFDKHYPDGDRIYRVVGVFNENGEIKKNVHFPAPMAEALKLDYPEIEKAGRFNNSKLFGAGSIELRRADKLENSYEEGMTFFDQELLEIFHLPVIQGNPQRALSEPNSIVITRRKAEKYFPGEDPLGKTLILNDNESIPYTIGGVIEDFPSTSHLQFDFLATLKEKQFGDGEQKNWGSSNYPVYVMVQPGTDVNELEKKITKGILDKYYAPLLLEEGVVNAKELLANAHLELQPVKDIHLYSADIHDRLSKGDIKYIWLFGAIALFILLIAIINFVNLSTAKSANRAKEVGLRKVVGSFRSNLVYQFLTESLLFSLLSFILGAVLATVLLPYFNILTAKSLTFPWSAWWLAPLLILSVVTVGVLAGIYPSFYLSSFKPIQVLKGDLGRGSRSSFMRSFLVVFQFTTSIILIVGTFIIYRQMQFILNTKVGFDKEQVLILQGTNTLDEKVKTLKEELKRVPGVQQVSISDYLPINGTKRNGNQFFIEGKDKVDKPVPGQFWIVDEDYIKTMGMKLVDGRDFNIDMASDKEAVIINQKMAKELGLKNPVNSRIQNWQGYTVIGVVEDFHYESFRQDIQPLAMRIDNSSSIVSVKISAAEMNGVIQSISKVWKELSPNQPIRYSFLDQSYAKMYDDVQRVGRIFTSCAVFAIIVACLGLFALSAFMVEQRSKEISIRLVLGASMDNILRLLTQNFVRLVLISFVIATPIAWYIMKKWLEDFAYRIDMSWDVFLLSGLLAVIIALLTISYQSVRAALANPATSLKSE